MGRLISARTLIVLIVGTSLAAAASADTITVCWDGSGDYLTIQEGIDAASDGDEVVVCDGTYTGVGNRNLNFGGKAITVRSENGPDTCIIDCEASGRGFRFLSGETNASTVDGFTITNGIASSGGGIYCYQSSPTISNCTISQNAADGGGHGGGIYCYQSSPTISNCMIAQNETTWWGGGVFCHYSNPTINNCTMTQNSSGME